MVRPSSEPGGYAAGPSLLRPGLRWLYLLVGVPVVTDWVENGRFPGTPREWITEVVAGVVLALLVRKVRMDLFALQELIRTDALTGLWNRRAFNETLADECVRAQRSQQPLSLVYMDLDNFKLINDGAGHKAGDQVLQQFADAIREVVRSRVDRAFRIGGDEFALLLPGSQAAQSRLLLERIREQCTRADALWVAGSLGISAGVVELDPREAAQALVGRADAAMYREKQERSLGKGRLP